MRNTGGKSGILTLSVLATEVVKLFHFKAPQYLDLHLV